jgi:hypothetical protein
MKELDDGEELCPFCGCINNPGLENVCIHFIALIWEGELNWETEEIRIIFENIEEIQQLIDEDNTNTPLTDRQKELCSLLGIKNSPSDILFELCGTDIRLGSKLENETFLSSGSGTTLYIKNLELLKSRAEEFRSLKAKLMNIS